MTREPAFHPLFLRLEGRRVVVVGGGRVALEKTRALKDSGARVRVVAPDVDAELVAVADDVRQRAFDDADLDDAWLAIAAATPGVNRRVRAAADARRLFTVAIDDTDHCSAIGAAQLRRGGLVVALSSSGRAPALVALLRRALERVVPDEASAWLELAERARPKWKAEGLPLEARRPLLLQALVSLYEDGHGRPA